MAGLSRPAAGPVHDTGGDQPRRIGEARMNAHQHFIGAAWMGAPPDPSTTQAGTSPAAWERRG